MRTLSTSIALATALGVAAPAAAQAYGCVAPPGLTAPPPAAQDAPTVRSPIAGYTMAISWSPEFCRGGAASAPDNAGQCARGATRFGFILHGLWPEAAHGASPQWCIAAAPLSAETIRANYCLSPSSRLQAHEWARHGTCMVVSPEAYAKVERVLWAALRFPDVDRLSRAPDLTAGQMRQAFVAANPGWPLAAVGLVTGPNGWLRELRLCYAKSFMPAACPTDRFGPRDSLPLKIWRGL